MARCDSLADEAAPLATVIGDETTLDDSCLSVSLTVTLRATDLRTQTDRHTVQLHVHTATTQSSGNATHDNT